ncbi:MAG: glycerol-phosphate dehydrogenase [Paenibacillaceae bacterium]|jgi:glycerol-1-phosphate dehydrogenase [NAD(P)+]|nr:glycerol-phosphate dehydrogenase [Paenibacillaceae bacterium]
MSDILEAIKQAASEAAGADMSALEMGPVVLEAGALRRIVPYLQESSLLNLVMVADETTYGIAGEALAREMGQAGIHVHVTQIKPNRLGDVIADEASVVQVILDVKAKAAQAVVAVGSGTLHDISRFSSYAAGIPFISVPTAPSVDGFNSRGAPLIIRGEKLTIPATGPLAIFADLDILTRAPSAMVAAGFADMLGKYTSLFDWKFGHLTAGEAYSPVVADITRRALEQCVEHVEEIARRSGRGIYVLTRALLESGFAMLLFGQSHSASGAEHHLSHYWEMEFLRAERRQLLHGAKVGVACAEIAKLYHGLAEKSPPVLPEQQQEVLLREIRQLPGEAEIRRLLVAVGGPSRPEELEIDAGLLARGLQQAHLIRPHRQTLLRLYNTVSTQ